MKKAQNIVEYLLIFALVAGISMMFATKFDIKRLRTMVFQRPTDSSTSSQITVEAMTK